jgi:hypothetical protein
VERRGIAPEVAAREVRSLELAIRARLWVIVMQGGVREYWPYCRPSLDRKSRVRASSFLSSSSPALAVVRGGLIGKPCRQPDLFADQSQTFVIRLSAGLKSGAFALLSGNTIEKFPQSFFTGKFSCIL